MRENVALLVENPTYFFEIGKHLLFNLRYSGGNVVLPMGKSRHDLFEYTISPYRTVNVGIYVKTNGFCRLVLSGVLKQWDTYEGEKITNKLFSYEELAIRPFSGTDKRIQHWEFPQALGLHAYSKERREFTETISSFLNYSTLTTWIEFSLCEYDLSALEEWFPFYRVFLYDLCQRNYYDDEGTIEEINQRVIEVGQTKIDEILSESRMRCDTNKWVPVNPFPTILSGFYDEMPMKIGGLFVGQDGRVEESKISDVVLGKKLKRSY